MEVQELFRDQSREVQRVLADQVGAKIVPMSMLYELWSEGKMPKLNENLLILASRVKRHTTVRDWEELQIQVEFEERPGHMLVQALAEQQEQDPLGKPDQVAIQQVLGGSDPAMVQWQGRERRKIDTGTNSEWFLEWIGFIPRNATGLAEVLRELSASSITEARHVRQEARARRAQVQARYNAVMEQVRIGELPQTAFAGVAAELRQVDRDTRPWAHREQNAGAFFPYMLRPELQPEDEWRAERTMWSSSPQGDPDDSDYDSDQEVETERDRFWKTPAACLPSYVEQITASPWTEEYRAWLSCCWEQLVHFGVPGVREQMAEQVFCYSKIEGFNAKDFYETTWLPWFKKKVQENKGFIREEDQELYEAKDYEMLIGRYWMSTPHCALVALEENLEHQATEEAKQALKELCVQLSQNRVFATKERITFSSLTKLFGTKPWVIEKKYWLNSKKQWSSDKLPKRDWAVQMKKPGCVVLKFGLWGNDHYFYWKEDVNMEFKTQYWPEQIRERMKVQCRGGGKRFPSMSSGRIMQRLIEEGLLKPLSGMNELYADVLEVDTRSPQEKMLEVFDELCRTPSKVVENCVVDTLKKLSKKIGSERTNVMKVFAGDTESMIDPETGRHDTCMMVIKGVYRNDIEICSNLWENKNVVRDGMVEFMKKYNKWLIEEITKNRPDKVSQGNWEKFVSLCKTLQNPTSKNIADLHAKWKIPISGTGFKELREPIIYFHHLGYDVQPFLCTFAPKTKTTAIKKGSVWYRTSFKCKYGCFELRNSLTIITTALRNFPKMFLPKEGQSKMIKEVYAYEAINKHLLEYRKPERKGFWVTLDTLHDAIEAFEKKKTKEEQEKLYEDLVKTASRPEVSCVDRDMFDVGRYMLYYCERDVDLLCLGLRSWVAIGEQDTTKNTFKGLPPFPKFDLFNFLSAPAIAQAVTEYSVREGYDGDAECLKMMIEKDGKLVPNPERERYTYKYKGDLRRFMLYATSGGRCTLANERAVQVDCLDNPSVRELYDKVKQGGVLDDKEKQFMFDHTIQDFDARSLYPTAMSRSTIPLGIPELVDWRAHPKTEQHIIAEAVDHKAPNDAMYLITHVKYDKKLAMPCNCWKQEKPEPRCRWTNDIPDDVVQLRKLRDLYTMIEVQGAHFQVLGGLEWRHGECTKIQDFMKKVYEFRRLNHSGGFDHPIQEAAKLIMNSYYGKNVTKMRDTGELFFPKRTWKWNSDEQCYEEVAGSEDLLRYLKHHWREIKRIVSTGEVFVVKIKQQDNGAYDACFGCEVLAGSRALICRVSAAIEEITKQPPLYTDTDSLHVFGWQIGAISEWFQNKFGIPMIGGELGQFHPDFEPQGFKPNEKFLGSVFFCGVGKKMYIDEVFGDQGSTYFHKRAKGIRAEWLSKDEYIQLHGGAVLEKDCDACGGVNIRPKNGVNYSVHLIKRVRATAEGGEVEVQDEFRTIQDNQLLIQNHDGELVDPDDVPTEDEHELVPEPDPMEIVPVPESAQVNAQKPCRKRFWDVVVEDMMSMTEPVEEGPVTKKQAEQAQKDVQYCLRSFDARDKAMMYETLERFLAGKYIGEGDWFFLGRIGADDDDRVYAQEAMRQLQQDLPQFQDELVRVHNLTRYKVDHGMLPDQFWMPSKEELQKALEYTGVVK